MNSSLSGDIKQPVPATVGPGGVALSGSLAEGAYAGMNMNVDLVNQNNNMNMMTPWQASQEV